MAGRHSAPRPGTAYSKDGTAIAFERSGDGPPIVLVDGALCYRASGPMRPIAARLAGDFTVYTYDRRGRGESGNTLPYAIDREVDDLDALIDEAGGSAFVLGISSGAALALEAARRDLAIRMLAMYEAPFIVDASRPPVTDAWVAELDALIAADRRADAVRLFMGVVGAPKVFVHLMRFMPAWSKLKGVAHTLAHDFAIVAPNQRGRALPASWASIAVPAVVIDGGKSPEWMRNATRAVADILPHATYVTLPGQTHMVNAKVLAAAIVEHFKAPARRQPATQEPARIV